MSSNDSHKKKATIWGIITLCLAMGLNLVSIVLRILNSYNTTTFYDLPQPILIISFMLVATVFYFLPIVQTHYYAKRAEIRWLYIISKILMIHFVITVAFATIILLTNIAQG